MNIIGEIFSTLGEVITGFFSIITTGITQATGLFWNSTTGFTLIGSLLLVGLGMGLTYFFIRFIVSFVKLRR